jgi:hypothetical protein
MSRVELVATVVVGIEMLHRGGLLGGQPIGRYCTRLEA